MIIEMERFVDSILSPLNVSSFMSGYFELVPAVLRRPAINSQYFQTLISIDQVSDLLRSFQIDSDDDKILLNSGDTSDWQLAKKIWNFETNAWTTSGLAKYLNITLQDVQHMCQTGSTLVINKIQRFHEKINMTIEHLEESFGHHMNCNLYATRMHDAGRQGFSAHFDWMDSVIIQVAGCKRWRIYDNTWAETQLPLPDMVFEINNSSSLALLPVAAEFDLTAGSVLSLPRGWIHEAATNCSSSSLASLPSDQVSLHLTFGIEAAVFTSIEMLLHHYVSANALDAGITSEKRTWIHLAIHSQALRLENLELRRAVRFKLLTGEDTPNEVDIEMIKSAGKSLLRQLDIASVVALGKRMGVLETPTCVSEVRKERSPDYILPFLADEPGSNTEISESSTLRVFSLVLEGMSVDRVERALAAMNESKRRNKTAKSVP